MIIFNKELSLIRLGSKNILKVFLGETQIFPSKASVRIVINEGVASISINGTQYTKSTVLNNFRVGDSIKVVVYYKVGYSGDPINATYVLTKSGITISPTSTINKVAYSLIVNEGVRYISLNEGHGWVQYNEPITTFYFDYGQTIQVSAVAQLGYSVESGTKEIVVTTPGEYAPVATKVYGTVAFTKNTGINQIIVFADGKLLQTASTSKNIDIQVGKLVDIRPVASRGYDLNSNQSLTISPYIEQKTYTYSPTATQVGIINVVINEGIKHITWTQNGLVTDLITESVTKRLPVGTVVSATPSVETDYSIDTSSSPILAKVTINATTNITYSPKATYNGTASNIPVNITLGEGVASVRISGSAGSETATDRQISRTYPANTSLMLSFTASTGYEMITGTWRKTLTAPLTISAEAKRKTYQLIIQKNTGIEKILVSSTDMHQIVTENKTLNIAYGTVIVLDATAIDGYVLDSAYVNSKMVTMNNNYTYSPTASVQTQTEYGSLYLEVGEGISSISVSPAIDSKTQFTQTQSFMLPAGNTYQLSATPKANYVLSNEFSDSTYLRIIKQAGVRYSPKAYIDPTKVGSILIKFSTGLQSVTYYKNGGNAITVTSDTEITDIDGTEYILSITCASGYAPANNKFLYKETITKSADKMFNPVIISV